jgi:hypothetical protein
MAWLDLDPDEDESYWYEEDIGRQASQSRKALIASTRVWTESLR